MGVKLPGGIELQRQRPDSETPSNPEKDPAEKTEQILSDLDRIDELGKSEKDSLEREVKQALEWMNYWRRQYLNLFFVPHTKQVLQWFFQYPGQTWTTYNTQWQLSIPDSNERKIVYETLVNYGMLRLVNNTIQVTEEGIAVLQIAGLLPSVPYQGNR